MLTRKPTQYSYSIQKLMDIVSYENRKTVEGGVMKASSEIIMDMGGASKIAQGLQTSLSVGIEGSEADIQQRQKDYGNNFFPPPEIKSLYEIVMENFDDPINRVLIAAAIVSAITGLIQDGFPKGLTDGVSIVVALLIIIVVGSSNNYASELKLAEQVSACEKQEVVVYRGSATATITVDASELVVGDIFYFDAGMKLPADAIMVEGQDVKTDESELTGEPDPMPKHVITEMNYKDGFEGTLMAKSLVMEGFGKGLVVAVGGNTIAGSITMKSMKRQGPTLLQEKLETIADKIGKFGIICATLTFVAMIIRIILEMTKVSPCGCQNIFTCQPDPKCEELSFALTMKNRLWTQILTAFILAITIVVAAIPEGLPLAVTLSLSFSSKKMQALNNLVRKIASSETMGGATHICSDKTGTLTLNKMTVMACMSVEKIFYLGNTIQPGLSKSIKEGTEAVEHGDKNVWEQILEGVLWNSTARIEKNDGKDPSEKEDYVVKGNPTESGITKCFIKAIGAPSCIDIKNKLSEDNILQTISFSSKRKRGSIIIRRPEHEGTDKEVRIYTKGAPDMLQPLLDC